MAKDIKTVKVLICDDSMMIRKKIRTILTNYGVENISEAKNGREAVEKFADINPDITLMDIVMPEMTGIEALKLIKTNAPDSKVVVVSSVGTQSNLAEAIKLGAADFLQKPIEEDKLKKLFDSLIQEV